MLYQYLCFYLYRSNQVHYLPYKIKSIQVATRMIIKVTDERLVALHLADVFQDEISYALPIQR